MYRKLLRGPGVRRLVLAALVARVPISMNATALVLLVHQARGSFAAAGAVTAAYALSGAIGSPLLARLIDRRSQARVLLASVAGYVAFEWGLVAAALGGAPTATLCALAAGAGFLIPPVSACMRSLWPRLVAGRGVPVATAFAFESVMVEAFFILGPLLAGLLVALASPAAALVTAGALSVTGVVLFATSPVSRAWRPEGGERSWAGPLQARGIRALAAASVPFGAAFGTLGVALPAFAVAHGVPGVTGVLWAAQAVGSGAGGLLYGARRWRRPLRRRFVELYGAFALGLAPLAAAGSVPVLVILIAVGGLALAPVTAASFELTDALAPAGTRTEAFTWVVTAQVAGSAAGAALAGALVQGAGARAGFVLAFGLAAAGAALALLVRPALRPAS